MTLVGTSGLLAAGPAAADPLETMCSRYVAGETLNIRSTPSTGGKIVDTLRKDEAVCGTMTKGGSYTACNKTAATWIGFYWKPTPPGNYGYVASTCMKG
ncbi:hypothetical protein ACFVUW_10860 [Streptomyces xiamenensis]|uniref:hypothetical protein n=1 Tax=Streptomyces xiamenensis TaxID=408015 RepID=UPI0036EDA451